MTFGTRSTYNPGFIPLGTSVYYNSREGMAREMKRLDMQLRRTPQHETMRRETLILKIARLKHIRMELNDVIKKNLGM